MPMAGELEKELNPIGSALFFFFLHKRYFQNSQFSVCIRVTPPILHNSNYNRNKSLNWNYQKRCITMEKHFTRKTRIKYPCDHTAAICAKGNHIDLLFFDKSLNSLQ